MKDMRKKKNQDRSGAKQAFGGWELAYEKQRDCDAVLCTFITGQKVSYQAFNYSKFIKLVAVCGDEVCGVFRFAF